MLWFTHNFNPEIGRLKINNMKPVEYKDTYVHIAMSFPIREKILEKYDASLEVHENDPPLQWWLENFEGKLPTKQMFPMGEKMLEKYDAPLEAYANYPPLQQWLEIFEGKLPTKQMLKDEIQNDTTGGDRFRR